MMNDLGEAIAVLKTEIANQEKVIARGVFFKLEDVLRMQGTLQGLERAHDICYRLLMDDEDRQPE